jgi:hypothetical protein
MHIFVSWVAESVLPWLGEHGADWLTLFVAAFGLRVVGRILTPDMSGLLDEEVEPGLQNRLRFRAREAVGRLCRPLTHSDRGQRRWGCLISASRT